MTEINKVPSTAFIQKGHPDADPANKEFVPCRQNQHYFYQDHSVHNLGQLAHGVQPGYCEKHLRLGCEVCSHA